SIQREGRLRELRGVVEWIDPERVQVGAGESHELQAHERNVIDERQVASYEPRELGKVLVGLVVNDEPDLDADPMPLEIQDPAKCLVIGAMRLNDVVVAFG